MKNLPTCLVFKSVFMKSGALIGSNHANIADCIKQFSEAVLTLAVENLTLLNGMWKTAAFSYMIVVFYKRTFSLRPLTVELDPRLCDSDDILKLALVFIALQDASQNIYTTNPSYFLLRSLIFALPQVHPIRRKFVQVLSNARIIRSIAGPPFVIYTAAAFICKTIQNKSSPMSQNLLCFSALVSSYAAILCRPDCDWLRTISITSRPATYRDAKWLHAVCMQLAAFTNVFELLLGVLFL